MSKFPIFLYLAVLSNISIAILAGWRVRNYDRSFFWLFMMFLLTVLTDISAIYFFSIRAGNTLWIGHLHTYFQFILIGAAFYHWLNSDNLKKMMLWIMAGFSLMWLVSKFTIERFDQYDFITGSISALFLLILAIMILHNLWRDNLQEFIWDGRFWICIAVVVYFSGSLVFRVGANELINLPVQMITIIWAFQCLITVLANLFYAGGFLCSRNT